MPRWYRQRDEVDLAWTRTMRRARMEIRSHLRDVEDIIANEVLSQLWDEFEQALKSGELKELESKYKPLVEAVIADHIPSVERIVEQVTPKGE